MPPEGIVEGLATVHRKPLEDARYCRVGSEGEAAVDDARAGDRRAGVLALAAVEREAQLL